MEKSTQCPHVEPLHHDSSVTDLDIRDVCFQLKFLSIVAVSSHLKHAGPTLTSTETAA